MADYDANAKWFRSWHGAPTDPKWLVIARRAQVAPGMVSAVFWALLDYASQHEDRGNVEAFDIETYAAFTGWEESDIAAVIDAMTAKGIITTDHRLAAWDKRQPKREDPTAAERQQRKRERDRVALQDMQRDNAATDVSFLDRDTVTRRHATSRGVTIDKIREDKIREEDTPSVSGKPDAAAAPSADADSRGSPGTLAEWHDLLKQSANKPAVLRAMFDKLYPDAIDTPDYARLGKTARQVGGAGRLAELMWVHSAHPPSGDVLAYLVRVSQNGAGRNGSDPKRMAETQTDYDALKARYVPKHLEELIEY